MSGDPGWDGNGPLVSEVFPDESRVLTAGEDGLTIVWSMSGTRHIKLGPFDSPVLCPLAPWALGEPWGSKEKICLYDLICIIRPLAFVDIIMQNIFRLLAAVHSLMLREYRSNSGKW